MNFYTRTAIEFSLAEILKRHLKYYKYLYSTYKKNRKDGKAYIKVIEYRYLLILEISALLESIINLYIAKKVNEKEFKDLESNSFRDKWIKIPCKFNPSYKIDDSTTELLELLIKYRKNIAHNKPYLHADGALVHRGNSPIQVNDEHQQIIEFAQLPILLLEQLDSFDDSLAMEKYMIKQQLKSAF